MNGAGPSENFFARNKNFPRRSHNESFFPSRLVFRGFLSLQSLKKEPAKPKTFTKMAVNASAATSSAVRALALELKSLQEDPLEGIRSRLVNEENLFEWEVALFGPPDTLYQGGYFKVKQLHLKVTVI